MVPQNAHHARSDILAWILALSPSYAPVATLRQPEQQNAPPVKLVLTALNQPRLLHVLLGIIVPKVKRNVPLVQLAFIVMTVLRAPWHVLLGPTHLVVPHPVLIVLRVMHVPVLGLMISTFVLRERILQVDNQHARSVQQVRRVRQPPSPLSTLAVPGITLCPARRHARSA